MIFSRSTAARTTAPASRSDARAAVVPAVVQKVAHRLMLAAFNEGRAVALTPAITDVVRYDGSWWLLDRESWLRVTDTALAADLDGFAERAARR